MERNLSLYMWYQCATSVLPWMPVFFLYFNQYVSLDQAIRLGAIYYFSVFLCEVPSGYISDRYGRRLTLIVSAVSLLLAYATFIAASDFSLLVVGKILLAIGIAFQSGSDTSLHYDSLALLKRESEYAARESKAKQYSMVALSLSCLAGGFLGSINLTLAYVASLVAALVTLGICLAFQEPKSLHQRTVNGFVQQLSICVGYLKDPVLLWIVVLFVLGYSLEHVPYEFYQPYIKLLQSNQLTDLLTADAAPIVSGIVIGVSMFGGALGATVSMRLLSRLGLRTLLLIGPLIQCVVIGGLSLLLHPALLILVMFRNFSMAMTHGPMLGAIGPRIDSAQRATFLSLQSLAGRLVFSVILFGLSILSGAGQALEWPALSRLLLACAGGGLLLLIGLTFRALKLRV